jgi:glycine/D-amino acid oxidase-like deaminating enzyme
VGTTVYERQPTARDVIVAALENTKLKPFWLDDVTHVERPALAGDIEADLVIVGAGYTGLWTAVQAKERDPKRSVIIVEAHTVGWAASGRNGGFCEPSLTHGYANGASRWPDEMETLERLGTQNIDEIEQTVKRYNMDVNFERNGSLTVAVEPHQVAELEGGASEGEPVMDADAIRAKVKSPTYLAAQSDGGDTALVHPAKLAYELARVATELGVAIYENSPVVGIGAGPVVRTATGKVRAAKVVLATNAFPSLLRRNALMTVPVYDYSLVTEPLTAAQMKSIGWKGREGIADMGNQFHYYRLTPDNRILFGGYDAIYHAGGKIKESYEDRAESYEKLAGHFFTTFPQLEGLKFTHRWGGVIDSCSRFCAFFGVARGGDVAYATGFTGLGVGASRFAAAVMLDLLSGEETERTRLQMVKDRPLPFPPEPIAAIGVNMVRWSMNRADHNDGKRNLLLKTLDKLGMGFDS